MASSCCSRRPRRVVYLRGLCILAALSAVKAYQRCTQASDCRLPPGYNTTHASTVCGHLFLEDSPESQTVCLFPGTGRPWPRSRGFSSPCYKNGDCKKPNATCSAIPWSSQSLAPPPENQCYSDGCSSAADCSGHSSGAQKGQRRRCASGGLGLRHGILPAASCVAATCASDSDCHRNGTVRGTCASFFPAYDGYPPSPGFHCAYPGDVCETDADCKSPPGQPLPSFCVWDDDAGKPKCEQVPPPPAPAPTSTLAPPPSAAAAVVGMFNSNSDVVKERLRERLAVVSKLLTQSGFLAKQGPVACSCSDYCSGQCFAPSCAPCPPSTWSFPGGQDLCFDPGPLGTGLLCKVDPASGRVTSNACCTADGPACVLPTSACCSTGDCSSCPPPPAPTTAHLFPALNDTGAAPASSRRMFIGGICKSAA